MALRPIRRYGDPVLRKKAEPVQGVTDEIRILIDDMVETMYDALGIGLAAPQIGVSLRVIVIDEGTRDSSGPKAFLNPLIVGQTGSLRGEEGCLSLPGVYGEVVRAEWVRVEALDRHGAPVRLEARGLLARVFQHELDHLDGMLFLDRLDRIQRDRIKRKIKREGLPESVPASALHL
jgi:peptide deformylase